nr:hypothetical protein [Variovorax sp. PBS-H4]
MPPICPASEATVTMRPCSTVHPAQRRSISRTHRKVPPAFTRITPSHSSSVMSTVGSRPGAGWVLRMPAKHTSALVRPSFLSTVSNAARTLPSSATLQARPMWPLPGSVAAARSAASARRSATARVRPSSASLRALASPSPPAAPVTSAMRIGKSPGIQRSGWASAQHCTSGSLM